MAAQVVAAPDGIVSNRLHAKNPHKLATSRHLHVRIQISVCKSPPMYSKGWAGKTQHSCIAVLPCQQRQTSLHTRGRNNARLEKKRGHHLGIRAAATQDFPKRHRLKCVAAVVLRDRCRASNGLSDRLMARTWQGLLQDRPTDTQHLARASH
eukprot:366000-Chlamydomonas_euryale.AAC.28